MIGLNQNFIDFDILDNDNTKNIVFLDMSKYFESPSNPILEIYLPGSSKYLMAQIQPGKINVLDSNTIGLSSIFTTNVPMDLPDGVYTFTYKFCPYENYRSTKYKLRTTFLDRDIQKIYDNVQLSECPTETVEGIKKDLLDIYIFIESAKANAQLNKPDRASKDFEIASNKVKKLTDKIIV